MTGGSSGIGFALARLLFAQGANVMLVARDHARLASAQKDIARSGKAKVISYAGDVSLSLVANGAVESAVAAFGGLDILANIAGSYRPVLVADVTDDDYRETLDANLTTTLAMTRAALPALRQSGGTIVNMSSMAARAPAPGLALYSASKAGIEAFTRVLAVEEAPHVRVNAVAAGPTLTENVRALMETDSTGAVAAVTRSLPLGRLAEPEEIAQAIAFLASPRASAITGQVLHANSGGLMA